MQELQVKHLKINTNLRFCSTFSDDLMTEIWQCENGHLVCENCFDKETFEERKNLSLQEKYSSLKSSVTTQSDLFSRRSVFDTRSATTLSEKMSCLEMGSYIRPKIDKIDFFENTLNIRKDDIKAYSDYNAEFNEEEDGQESIIFGDKLENVDEETVFYNKFL